MKECDHHGDKVKIVSSRLSRFGLLVEQREGAHDEREGRIVNQRLRSAGWTREFGMVQM